MGSRRGAFIVIEGTDGSGKGTQFELIKDRLAQAGYSVEAFDFPQYDQPSSYFVSQYLNGAYGTAEQVGPYTASLFYALDRFEAAPRIRKALDEGKIVISNRFTGSSMGHQGTKFRNPEERRGYFIWLDNLEFEMLNIPRPDVSFILRVPAEIAQGLVDSKPKRSYTDKKRDIHEADLQHLRSALSVYDDMAQLFPKDFQRIDCVRSGKLLDIETIHSMLWEKIVPLLPQPPQLEMPMPVAKHEVAAVSEDVPAGKASAPDQPTDSDKPIADSAPTEPATPPATEAADPTPKHAPDAISNLTGNVYAFTDKLDAGVVAAVMASLTRGGGELSTTVLDSFAEAVAKDEEMLGRTIRAYGDVAQRLVSQSVIVSHASALLALAIQESRLSQYVTTQPRYLHYEQKDSNGLYKYYVPTDLDSTLAVQYRHHMDKIFDTYAAMLPKLTAHLIETSGVPVQGRSNDWQAAMHAEAHSILQSIVPVAATATIGIYGSAAGLEALIVRLLSHNVPEIQMTGRRILIELRKTIPDFMSDVEQPERGGSETAYRYNVRRAMAKLTESLVPSGHAAESSPVNLASVWPRNELDLTADMLYEYSNLPLRSLQQTVDSWPYSRKLTVFEAYFGERLRRRERPGRALEKARYSWDIVHDFSVYRELQQHQSVDDPEHQMLTPRYGYDVPQVIEAAGLSDDFEACFDISLKLHSTLHEAGHPTAAQYATLQGHKLRFKLSYTAREAFRIHELHTTPRSTPQLRDIALRLHTKLLEVHPLIGEAMHFVEIGETAELTELAADRYTQFKRHMPE